MVKEEYKVSSEFILEAFNAACNEWKDKIRNEFPDLFPRTYKRGDRFIRLGEREFILVSIDSRNKVLLISLENGNRWFDAVTVEDDECITDEEMNKITCRFNWKTEFKLKE
jgi:hypothetical protein